MKVAESIIGYTTSEEDNKLLKGVSPYNKIK